jgi:hypothetical protein
MRGAKIRFSRHCQISPATSQRSASTEQKTQRSLRQGDPQIVQRLAVGARGGKMPTTTRHGNDFERDGFTGPPFARGGTIECRGHISAIPQSRCSMSGAPADGARCSSRPLGPAKGGCFDGRYALYNHVRNRFCVLRSRLRVLAVRLLAAS